ncbi:MAG: hypothetical protein IJR49_04090 [Treponema sp.]|nr:hypothetical protein [Treponema sp.]
MKFRNFILSIVLMTSIFVGCKFETNILAKNNNPSITKTKWANLVENRPTTVQQFDGVGVNHNEMLDDLYSELSLYKNSPSRKATLGFLSNEEINIVINKFFFENTGTRSATEIFYAPNSEKESYVFSNETQHYINIIDDVVSNKDAELDIILADIEQIEIQAESNIPEIDKNAFFSYTATIRASLAYWTEHLEEWDALRGIHYEDSQIERGAILNWFKKQRKKIAMCAASDAAGAAVGAGIGAGLGSAAGGPGAVVGAAIGATIVGAASSAQGWSTGELCIVIPWSKLKSKFPSGE